MDKEILTATTPLTCSVLLLTSLTCYLLVTSQYNNLTSITKGGYIMMIMFKVRQSTCWNSLTYMLEQPGNTRAEVERKVVCFPCENCVYC